MHRSSEVLSDQTLIERVDGTHCRISHTQRELFSLIAEVDRRELWRDSGARDMAQWLWMRYGLSDWKARRWIAAAHAIEDLPAIAEAFSAGELGIDKVVELTRFATPATETDLLRWAQGVSCGAIRHRGDLTLRQPVEEAAATDADRSLSWWYLDEGRRLAFRGEYPVAAGAVIMRGIERTAEHLPVMPGEEGAYHIDARRADALVAMASGGMAGDPDRTVVVHATVEALGSTDGACEVEGGGVIHAETARRLLCHARVQAVLEDAAGTPIGLGRTSREPSASMVRLLRHRDRECTFPGCGARRFTQAHHVVWWSRGGPTDLENLILLCSFHHKLVHEHRWRVERDPDGTVRWFHPDGRRYRAGPAPPRAPVVFERELVATGA